MGAAAALEAVVAVRALQAQCVPGTIGLVEPDPAIFAPSAQRPA